jgi:uncharacterized protein (DUF58 family)
MGAQETSKVVVFDEATLRKLEQLSLTARRVRVGLMKGERRSRKRGASIEFADYRDYSRGDDLRRLDWNLFARLERPFIKLLEEEEDLAVHILIDASASMDWPKGAEETNKFDYARRIAAGLAYIALVTGDLVSVSWLTDKGVSSWGPFRGRQNGLLAFQYLENGRAIGQTNLNVSLRHYALRAYRPGLLILISDLFSPDGYVQGINALLGRGYELALLQLLSPDEITPQIDGDVKLVDSETGRSTDLTLDMATIDLYQHRLEEWQSDMARHAASQDYYFVPISTDLSWDALVLQVLRSREVIE